MTTTIVIAPLESHHRSNVESIVRATGVFSEDEVGVALEVFDSGAADDYEFIGAFDESGALLGYACFGQTPSADRTFDLYWIAVHPSAQRGGTGAALMDEVERRLNERRARLLVLETSSRDDYAATRRFYDKRGYQQAARLQDFYSVGDDRIVLARRMMAAPGSAAPLPLPA